jgi:hypothetical protein
MLWGVVVLVPLLVGVALAAFAWPRPGWRLASCRSG